MGAKRIAYINKDILVWARSRTPFSSPEEVSKNFNEIDSEKLKKWENGEELPSISEAKRLAKIYRLPFACFFLSQIPTKEPKKYIDRRTNLGTEYGVMSYELWSELTRVSADRDTIINFFDKNASVIELPEVSNSDTPSDIANKIRKFLNMPPHFKHKKEYKDNSFNFYKKKIEEKDIIVAQISKVSLSEMKGLSIFEKKFPIIAINNKDFERAKTFSLFHELAHLMRRSSSLCLIDDYERNDSEEKICDAIAANALMPEDEFKRLAYTYCLPLDKLNITNILKLADKFGVSMVSAFRRLFNLKLIDDSTYYFMYGSINNEFEKNKKAIEEKMKNKNVPFYFHVGYINLHGRTLPKTIVTAHNNGKISIGEACKIMGIKTKYFNDVSMAAML